MPRGGARPGGGLDPLYEKAMPKVPLRLSVPMAAYLEQHESAAAALRNLLEWGGQNPDRLLDDPGPTAPIKRSSYALDDRHIRIAERLGGGEGVRGSRVAGVRRVIHTAMHSQVNAEEL